MKLSQSAFIAVFQQHALDIIYSACVGHNTSDTMKIVRVLLRVCVCMCVYVLCVCCVCCVLCVVCCVCVLLLLCVRVCMCVL